MPGARCSRSLVCRVFRETHHLHGGGRRALYFKRRPQPKKPQDLTAHDCINIRLPTYGGIYVWEFEKRGHELKVQVDGQLVFNNLALRLNAALAGAASRICPKTRCSPTLLKED